MEERKYKDERRENRVYEAYSKWYDPYDNSSDNPSDRKLILWNEATMWLKDVIFKENTKLFSKKEGKIDERDNFLNGGFFCVAGDEIFLTIDDFIRKNKMPKELFLMVFEAALRNAIKKSYKKLSSKEKGEKKIFVYKTFGKGDIAETRDMKKIRKIKKTLEEDAGRELTEDELVKRFSRGLTRLSEKTLRSHLKFISKNNGDYIPEHTKAHSLTITKRNSYPETERNSDTEMEVMKDIMEDSAAKIIIDDFKEFLSEQQERTRDDYKALFTGICIKLAKNEENEYTEKENKYTNDINYLRKIESILDPEIIEDYRKEGIVRDQYEIYMIKHPGKSKKSAAKEASEKVAKIKEFQKAMKEKHPEIYSEAYGRRESHE